MHKLQFKIIFKESDSDIPIQQIIDELVRDTIRKVLTQYADTGYNVDNEKDQR